MLTKDDFKISHTIGKKFGWYAVMKKAPYHFLFKPLEKIFSGVLLD